MVARIGSADGRQIVERVADLSAELGTCLEPDGDEVVVREE
jgi:hypothetical protein